MNTIHNVLEQLDLGKPVEHDGLSMFPLLGGLSVTKDYLTLDEALAANAASVVEVSESGSVPSLLFRNNGEKAVFLLDGEELVGAKQNRILNISILAPAMKDTVIPVSCVEAGRWSQNSPDFRAAPRAQFSESRARRSAHVSEDIKATGNRRSNQADVWHDVSMKLASLGSHSPSQAVERAFEDNADRLERYVRELRAIDGQFGAVFAVHGRVTGLEVFDCPETCGSLLPKIIRSYALDAIDPRTRGREQGEAISPEKFLQQVAGAKYHESDAVGEGADLRFENGNGLAGGALKARDRIVHLVAFRLSDANPHASGRVHRAYFR